MTKKEALSLLAEARALGFEGAIGQLRRGQWYLSVSHRTQTHWAFTTVSYPRLKAVGLTLALRPRWRPL